MSHAVMKACQEGLRADPSVHGMASRRDRDSLYDQLHKENTERLCLREITLPELGVRGHRHFVFDATMLPTESHYVPIMLNLVEAAEVAGRITPGVHALIETSTGNAGSAAAYVARLLGYPVIVMLPDSLPPARVTDVRRYLPQDGWSRVIFSHDRYVEGMVEEFAQFLQDHPDSFEGKPLYPINHSKRSASVVLPKSLAHMEMCG